MLEIIDSKTVKIKKKNLTAFENLKYQNLDFRKVFRN